jgi:hypothetical protein
MAAVPLVLLTLAVAAGPGHEQANPLYRELREAGVPVPGVPRSPLPPPTMPDGLNDEGQQGVLKKLAGEDFSLEELTRESVVAPHILRISITYPLKPQCEARSVDVWFIAHGDLDKLAGRKFLERVMNSNQKEGRGRDLSPEELARHGVAIKPADEKYEGYGHVVFSFLDRVEITATARSYWTRTADSLLIASKLDPRFATDAKLSNRWRSQRKNDEGRLELGPAHAYDGAGYYVKITRLARPKGALFVEGHLIFLEPRGWFEGRNLLRSKLPPVVQDRVRTTRREILRASTAGD